MNMRLRITISAATGFDEGELFETEKQVRDYFTVAEQQEMFGDEAETDQELLDEWAEEVIERRWHMRR